MRIYGFVSEFFGGGRPVKKQKKRSGRKEIRKVLGTRGRTEEG